MQRNAAIAMLALSLANASPSSLGAQAPPMRGSRATLTLGVQQLDLGGMNDRLEQAGYGRFGGRYYRIGYADYRVIDAFLIGGEIDFMFPTELRVARGEVANAHSYATTGMLNVGYAVRASQTAMVYPLIGIGGGMLGLHVSRRCDASFDEMIANPGRTTSMSEWSWLYNIGAGVDQLVILRRTPRAADALIVGARQLYTGTLSTGGWRYARTPFAQPRLEGGPETGINGIAVALSIGRAPRPSR